jgi:hypothetical protein
MWIKVTNCTTITGGGKKPERIRKNQNVTTSVKDDFSIKDFLKRPFIIKENGKEYTTTSESKIIILNN